QPEIFIRAFARIAADHPDVRLKFLGQGAVEQELRRLAGELLPGRVDFGGVVEPAEFASWIRGAIAALVSIVPGIGYDIARPPNTFDAVASEQPVIFSRSVAGVAVVR